MHEDDQERTDLPQAAVPFGEQATGAYTAQPVPDEPVQVGSPGFEGFPAAQPYGGGTASSKKWRTGLIIGIAVVAILGLLLLIGLPLVLA